ncbi:MAG: hypothetical protein ACTSO9_15195 [Candidatus Helarchaeota archaeon]
MEEVKNAAKSSFVGFLMIFIGFILILINLLQYSKNYTTIIYIMFYFNLVDLALFLYQLF